MTNVEKILKPLKDWAWEKNNGPIAAGKYKAICDYSKTESYCNPEKIKRYQDLPDYRKSYEDTIFCLKEIDSQDPELFDQLAAQNYTYACIFREGDEVDFQMWHSLSTKEMYSSNPEDWIDLIAQKGTPFNEVLKRGYKNSKITEDM